VITPQKQHLLVETIRKLIRREADVNLNKILSKTHPADIALLFKYFSPLERKMIFSLLLNDTKRAAEVLSEVEPATCVELLGSMDRDKIPALFGHIAADDKAEILAHLPKDLAEEILQLVKEKDSQEVEALMKYAEDTAGRIMTTNFFSLNEDVTIKDAIQALQEASHVEMVFYLYVTDQRGHLVGVVDLRQLLLHPPTVKLKDIMIPDVERVTTDMDQEEVARIVAKYNILAVPVVDEENKLVGIITVDDVIDVIRDEATEDILKMAGTSEEEIVYGEKIFKIARVRLPWLITNLFGGIITGYLMWLFKITIRDILAIVTFIPVITAMGGNLGTQSASIVVRGFATGRIDFKSLKRVILKEIKVGILMGFICGSVVGVFAYLWHGIFYLGVVVAVAMVSAMTVASLVGTLAPAVFKSLRIDPAVSSGPFVTTANDITGILIYLGTATFFLKYLVE